MLVYKEFLRRWKERKGVDPRVEQVSALTTVVRGKMRELYQGASEVYIDLDSAQSERLFPSTEDAPPIQVTINRSPHNDIDYSFVLDRGEASIIFELDDDGGPSLTRPVPNSDKENRYGIRRAVGLGRHGADALERNLQALTFGNKVSDFLLQVREESPEIFEYQ